MKPKPIYLAGKVLLISLNMKAIGITWHNMIIQISIAKKVFQTVKLIWTKTILTLHNNPQMRQKVSEPLWCLVMYSLNKARYRETCRLATLKFTSRKYIKTYSYNITSQMKTWFRFQRPKNQLKTTILSEQEATRILIYQMTLLSGSLPTACVKIWASNVFPMHLLEPLTRQELLTLQTRIHMTRSNNQWSTTWYKPLKWRPLCSKRMNNSYKGSNWNKANSKMKKREVKSDDPQQVRINEITSPFPLWKYI